MATTNYIWDELSDNIVLESDEGNSIVAVFLTTPTRFGKPLSQIQNGLTSIYHYDGEQSVRLLTDSDENVTDTMTYTAFGETLSSTGSSINPFRFKGEVGYYSHSDTNAVYVRARTYSPDIGRWLSLDPLFLSHGIFYQQSYEYANNSPTKFVDPTGLISCPVFCTSKVGPFKIGEIEAPALFTQDGRNEPVFKDGYPNGIGSALHFREKIASEDKETSKKSICCRTCAEYHFVQVVKTNSFNALTEYKDGVFLDNNFDKTTPFYDEVAVGFAYQGRRSHAIPSGVGFANEGDKITSHVSIYDLPFRSDKVGMLAELVKTKEDFKWQATAFVFCRNYSDPDIQLHWGVTYGFVRKWNEKLGRHGDAKEFGPACAKDGTPDIGIWGYQPWTVFESAVTNSPWLENYDLGEEWVSPWIHVDGN